MGGGDVDDIFGKALCGGCIQGIRRRPMPALTDRQAARERLTKMFESALDRVIPADEEVALKGSTFADFEEVC